MMQAGIATLAASYGLSLIGGAVLVGIDNNLEGDGRGNCVVAPGSLFVPLVGPFIFAARFPSYGVAGQGDSADCGASTVAAALPAVGIGIVQLVGAGLIAGGGVQLALGPKVGGGFLRFAGPSGAHGATWGWAW